jgi:INO80 complex subunit C
MAQPSPSGSGTSTPLSSIPLESLDFGHPTPHPPRPFKRPPLRTRHPRRNKTLKQIFQDEQKALAAALAVSDPAAAAEKSKTRAQGKLRPEGLHWGDIDAPPSLLPQKRYCDVTGLEGRYTDPKSKLRFHNSEVYAVIQTLPQSVDQEVKALYLKGGGELMVVFGVEECECGVEVEDTTVHTCK